MCIHHGRYHGSCYPDCISWTAFKRRSEGRVSIVLRLGVPGQGCLSIYTSRWLVGVWKRVATPCSFRAQRVSSSAAASPLVGRFSSLSHLSRSSCIRLLACRPYVNSNVTPPPLPPSYKPILVVREHITLRIHYIIVVRASRTTAARTYRIIM